MFCLDTAAWQDRTPTRMELWQDFTMGNDQHFVILPQCGFFVRKQELVTAVKKQ